MRILSKSIIAGTAISASGARMTSAVSVQDKKRILIKNAVQRQRRRSEWFLVLVLKPVRAISFLRMLPTSSAPSGRQKNPEHSEKPDLKPSKSPKRRPLPEGGQYPAALLLPSFGHLHLAALVAATYVLIPVKPAPYALAGLKDLFDTIKRARKYFNPNLKILGIIKAIFCGFSKAVLAHQR